MECVAAACLAAVAAYHRKSLKTRSLATEILYSLAPHTKIATALQHFGTLDSDEYILAVTIDGLLNSFTTNRDSSDNADSTLRYDTPFALQVGKAIQGELISVDKLKDLIDVPAITKLFKITQDELLISTLSEGCIARMACKTCL